MIKKIIFILLIFISYQTTYAQDKIESSDLIEDFTILKDITIGLSPKLTIEDKNRINNAFNIEMAELENKSFSSLDFFRFILGFKRNLNTKFDEHAVLSLPSDVMMPFLSKSKLFPLPLKLIGNHLVVNSTETDIPFGSIIESIDGLSSAVILNDLLGKKDDTFSKKRLEEQFALRYLLNFQSSDNFALTFRNSLDSDILKKENALGITFLEYQKAATTKAYPLNRDQLSNQINTFYNKESKMFYLQFNSFNWREKEVGNEYKQFEKLFNKIFNEIKEKGAENLIIDLRFNSGGNVKIPALLYSYIAKEEFTEKVSLKMPDIEIPRTENAIALDGERIDKIKDVKKFIKSIVNGFEKVDHEWINNYTDNKTIKEGKNNFKGRVYLLVGGNSVSASSYFTSLFQANKRGVIVGQQLGGSHHDITAGHNITYQLPNSKIEIKVPIMVVRFSDEIYKKVPELKISPDIELSDEEEYNYVIAKQDPELEKVKEIITKSLINKKQ